LSATKKILITGGCGFVGANLLEHLVRDGGYAVRVLDDESLGKRAHITGLPVDFIRGDIRDRAVVEQAVEGMDAVVHLAAHTRVIESVETPALNFDVNVNGSLTILEAMRRLGVKRLISASTGGAILGDVEPPVHEEMVPRPISPYGASKLAVEGYCSAYAGSYGIRTLSLRFANVYGPRSFHKGSAVAAFFRTILSGKPVTIYGDGSQTRDFIFVGDLCNGIVSGINSDACGVIQLGSGRPVTVDALLDTMSAVVAPRAIVRDYQPFRDGEIRETWCDIAKARRLLGFEPHTPLQQGLAQTWKWFTEQG
jgi:UDP-glucose 4-epimerase